MWYNYFFISYFFILIISEAPQSWWFPEKLWPYKAWHTHPVVQQSHANLNTTTCPGILSNPFYDTMISSHKEVWGVSA